MKRIIIQSDEEIFAFAAAFSFLGRPGTALRALITSSQVFLNWRSQVEQCPHCKAFVKIQRITDLCNSNRSITVTTRHRFRNPDGDTPYYLDCPGSGEIVKHHMPHEDHRSVIDHFLLKMKESNTNDYLRLEHRDDAQRRDGRGSARTRSQNGKPQRSRQEE